MMIEQHYDEEVLIALLDDQSADPHLQACDTCKSALHSIRQVTSALHDDTVWDRRELSEEPKASTRDALRFAATSVAVEDAAAEPWVKSLLAKSSTEWAAMVAAHPEWKTAGFVRRLIVAVDAINFTAPTDAVELMRIAVEVAEALPGSGDRVAKLRAAAWREYAYALFYVGSHAQSLEAVNACDAWLANTSIHDFESARSLLVRASIFTALERFAEINQLTQAARRAFVAYGDDRRATIADITEGASLMWQRQYRDALIIQRRVMDAAIDDVSRASAKHNAAICCRELGRLAEARVLFAECVEAYERLGVATFLAKARWNFANILVADGDYDLACKQFASVTQQLTELGVSHDAALVAVDNAEALVLAGRVEQVPDVCRLAMAYFSNADLNYSRGALTALAYLREAAESGRLTVQHVGQVRSFFEILPKQPHLLFAQLA